MMKALGWVLIIIGFAWIVLAAGINPALCQAAWSDALEFYREEKSYTKQDIVDAMVRVGQIMSRRLVSPLWGGFAMLAGAGLACRQTANRNS